MAEEPLTVERFVQHFRDCTGWECLPDTRITNELTAFATERLGSTRDIDELHVIFCMSKSIQPYANPPPQPEERPVE